MTDFKLPLSGDVSQSILPWTWYFQPKDSQFGLININLGTSSKPEVERDVLAEVASYGKQIGRIADVVEILLKHFDPKTPLSEDERARIDDLTTMLHDIAKIKRRHGRG
jgi:hypothetical protein